MFTLHAMLRNAPLLMVGVLALTSSVHCAAQDDAALRPAWPHPTCNSAANDYAAVQDVDGSALLFTSERDGVAQTYLCRPDGSTELMPGSFNQPGKARAFVSLSSSGNGVATSYRLSERQTYASIVGVVRTAAGLDIAAPVETANGEFYAAQATVAPDQSRILFVTDREGGLGGLDIWMIERRVDGSWSEPQHAGAAINSPGDEMTPVLVAADTLLFASDAMGGSGGHDIFLSVNRSGRWSDPVPVTALNSVWNDTDAVRLNDGTYCFSSDRPGGRGGLDIWLWRAD